MVATDIGLPEALTLLRRSDQHGAHVLQQLVVLREDDQLLAAAVLHVLDDRGHLLHRVHHIAKDSGSPRAPPKRRCVLIRDMTEEYALESESD